MRSWSSKLSSPLDAIVHAKVAQAADHQWQVQLEVPRFDPREELMPDSSFHSLAATLHGEGTLNQGVVSGRVMINDEPVELESVRFTLSEERLKLESLLKIGATRRRADGQRRYSILGGVVGQQGKHALAGCRRAVGLGRAGVVHARRAGLRWQSKAVQREGRLRVGPQKQQADIALQVRGMPELVELQQLDIM